MKSFYPLRYFFTLLFIAALVSKTSGQAAKAATSRTHRHWFFDRAIGPAAGEARTVGPRAAMPA